nr:MAG: hypothetical protein DIU78_10385 [Pseudomonadota bacterium]
MRRGAREVDGARSAHGDRARGRAVRDDGAMSRRTLVRGLFAVVVAVLAGYFLLPDSPERRVLRTLETLAQSLRTAFGEDHAERRERIATIFRRSTTPNVTLVAPELGTVEGIDELVGLAASAVGVDLSFEPSGVEVTDRSARARLLVHLSFRIPGEEIRQKRTASVVLRRAGDDFLVERVEVSLPSHEEPEARP